MRCYILAVVMMMVCSSPESRAQNSSAMVVVANSRATGVSADEAINECISALPASGGICDARELGATTQAIKATLTVGTLTKMVTLLLNRATKFQCTITNNTPCLQLGGGSAIVADGETEALSGQGGGFVLTDQARVSNVLKLVDQASGAGFSIENIVINTNPRAVVRDSVVNLTNPLQVGTVRGLTIGGYRNTVLLKITETVKGSAGPINVYNPELDCGMLSSCKPLVIEAVRHGGSMGGLNFYGGTYVHPGADAGGIVQLKGITGNEVAGVNFYGPYLEASSATDVGFLIENSTGVLLSAPFFSAQRINAGYDCVKIVGDGTDNVVVQNLDNFNQWRNNIDNLVNHRILPSSLANRMALYIYNSAPRANTSVWDDAVGNLGTIDANGFTLKTEPFSKLSRLASNGTLVYCNDCQIKGPCVGGGRGALAKKINDLWICN